MMSWRSLITVASLSCLNVCWGFMASIMAPFLPLEAQAKGASASQFGPIFGIIHLALFIISPVMGKVISRVGLGNVFKGGLILITVASLSFGLLTFLESPTLFLVLAYTLRIVEGVGGSALWTSMLALLLASFPTHPGLVYSLVDGTFGTGYLLGPVIGAVLYNAGGFLFPFLISGLIFLLMSVQCIYVVRHMTRYAEDLVESSTSSASISPLVRDVRVMVPLLSATTAALTIGYIESLLELHLQTFSLSVSSVGLCFLTMSLTYTATTLITGYCVDKILQPITFSTTGLLLLLLAFTLIGPAPFLPLAPSLPLTLLSLVLQGAGAALVLVSTFSSSLAATLSKEGYTDSPSTFSLVSGLWTSAFALGNFVGPSVAGVIYDKIGFQWGTVCVEGVLLLMISFNLWTCRLETRLRRLHHSKLYEAI